MTETLNLRSTGTKKTKTPRGVPLDWAAGHGPITGALSATTGAGAAALLGAATSMPSGWPLAVGVAGALGHGIGASIRRRLTGWTVTTRAASWLLAGGWTSWAVATGPLSWAALGSLAALGVGIGAAASHAAVVEEAAEEERLSAEAAKVAAELSAERREIAAEWTDRIRQVVGTEVRIYAVEKWETGKGYSLEGEMLTPGATWTLVQNAARALATAARLPLGCAIHVEEGDRQGRVILDVPTANVMADVVDYPADFSPLSILDGIPWGMLPHGEPVSVMLREAGALILGPPGSGKSTFADAILTGFARCVDVLTFAIDLKAGAIGRNWVRPFLEAEGRRAPLQGQAPAPAGTRPGVDWLAGDPAEALRMVNALLRINAARQHAYQDLMDRADTTLLPVSAEIPQIMLVIDEGAELLSAASFTDETMKALQKGVKKLIRTTRAMGIRTVITAVDGNVSAIGDTEIRKFSPVAAALTSGEGASSNVNKLWGRVKVDTSQLSEKGAGVIAQAGGGGFAPTPFKGWRTSPSMVRAAVLATSARRPVLDRPSAEAAGTDYAQRWSPARSGWMDNATPTAPTAAPGPGTAPAAPAAEGSSRLPRELNLSYRRQEAGLDPEEAVARLMREIDATYGTTTEPGGEGSSRLPRELNLSYRRREKEAERDRQEAEEKPDARAAALDLIRAAGPEGTGASALERELRPVYGTRRPTIQEWLKEWAESGDVHRVGEGSKTRYVHREHHTEG